MVHEQRRRERGCPCQCGGDLGIRVLLLPVVGTRDVRAGKQALENRSALLPAIWGERNSHSEKRRGNSGLDIL